MTETATRVSPSPLAPTEVEQAPWNRLTQDEQIARYREYLSHSDCDEVSDATTADVLAEARAAVKHPLCL